MTIIDFAFLQDKNHLSDERKQKFIEQKERQIQFIQSKPLPSHKF